MSLFRSAGVLSALATWVAILPGAVQAADNTRYVSISGSNANACTLAAPCRSLQTGISKTPAGGELRILESGFYGNNATINKSLTISGNGNTVYLGKPIVVDKAGAVVNLRGLTLDGQSTVVDGIRIVTAAAVNIERCTIHSFTQDGIQAAFGPFDLFIKDSTVHHNKKNGLLVAGLSGSSLHVDNSHFDYNGSFTGTGGGGGMSITVPVATISRSTISGNNSGLSAGNGTSVSIVSTVASGNLVGGGFHAGNGSKMTLESSIASGNNSGLSVSSSGLAQISNSTFSRNLCCGIVNQGTIHTRLNNTIKGNASDSIAGNALVPFGAQ
jgi:hypothetical protein